MRILAPAKAAAETPLLRINTDLCAGWGRLVIDIRTRNARADRGGDTAPRNGDTRGSIAEVERNKGNGGKEEGSKGRLFGLVEMRQGERWRSKIKG